MKVINAVTHTAKNYIKHVKPLATPVEQPNKLVENKQDLLIKKLGVEKQTNHLYQPTPEQRMKNLVNNPVAGFSNINTRKSSYFYSSTLPMDKPIDVTNDYIFKGIFGEESRVKNFLEGVLIGDGKILPKGTEIEELEYLQNEHIQNELPDAAKKIMFDLQIKTTSGIYIIEMQKNVDATYLKRVEFYNATAYSNQDIKGEGGKGFPMKDYDSAYPIVTISILSKNLFPDNVPCVSYHKNVESKTQQQYMSAFSYVFVELDKFGDANNSKFDLTNITDDERDWISLMKDSNLTKLYSNKEVQNAVTYVQNIRDNKYDTYIRTVMTETARLKDIESAESVGVEKGKIEIAKNLLSMNIPGDKVVEATGLSKEEILKLKSK
jgi:predicted transposase/invertase (TIGR01784 family)